MRFPSLYIEEKNARNFGENFVQVVGVGCVLFYRKPLKN